MARGNSCRCFVCWLRLRAVYDIKHGILVKENTTKAWYNALKKAVDDKQFRDETVKLAQEELQSKWRLEDNWQQYKVMFEKVKEYKDAQHKTSEG